MRQPYLKFLSIIVFALLALGCSNDDATTNGSVDTPDPTDDNPTQGFLGEIDYVKTFGGSGEDDALSVTKTLDGGIAVFGFTQSIDGDVTGKSSTDSDYWLLKLDANGNKQWDQVYGGSDDDRGQKIIATSDGGFAVIGFSRSNDGEVSDNNGFYDYWVLKLDASGNIQWSKTFGFPGSDRSFSLTELHDGGFFLTGFLDVTASGGEGNDLQRKGAAVLHGVGEFWGIRLDENGNQIWRRYFGGTNNDRSYDVIQTSTQDILMVGSSESDDFDITNPKGSYDIWVVKTDLDGNLLWQKNFGGSSIEIGYSVTETQDGNFVLAGDTRSSDGDISNPMGNSDFWMIKFDPLGNLIWEKTLGGSDFDSARSIEEFQNGDLLISGSSKSQDHMLTQNYGNNDAWAVITDGSGIVKWQSTFGGSDLDFINQAIQLEDLGVVLIGNTESADYDVKENKGSKDILLIKLK